MGYLAFPPSGWLPTALAETPIQLLALTPAGNCSIEKEPVCSRIYLEKNSSCFFLKWNGSQRWALASKLRGRRKVCHEQASQLSGCCVFFFFPKQQTDSQHRSRAQGPLCSSPSLTADLGPPKHILTALHTTGIWTKAETIPPPPSIPGEHHTRSPLSPALMHTQRQKQERWKSKPRALTALSLNPALYKPIQPAQIPAHPSKRGMLSHMLL